MKAQISFFAGIAMLASMSAFAQSAAPIANVRAVLSGVQEVPAVISPTSGVVRLIFNEALSEIRYALAVRNGTAVTAAHLHCARAGANGPVVAFLYSGPTVNANGLLKLGIITNADVNTQLCDSTVTNVDDIEVNNVASLFQAAKDGLIYANVHTTANSGGEVRGQVFP
jgi:hypothetical protein